MIPILIYIFLILLVSSFVLGFLYNEVFLYAACVISIIFGLLLITNGIHLPIGENTTSVINALNVTETSTLTTYETFNNSISNAVGLLLILIGIAFTYFENKGRNDGKDQQGQDGVWI